MLFAGNEHRAAVEGERRGYAAQIAIHGDAERAARQRGAAGIGVVHIAQDKISRRPPCSHSGCHSQ